MRRSRLLLLAFHLAVLGHAWGATPATASETMAGQALADTTDPGALNGIRGTLDAPHLPRGGDQHRIGRADEATAHFRWDRSTRPVRTGPVVPSPAAPIAHPGLVGAHGNVVDLAQLGSTLYVAGNFRRMGHNTGGFVPVDTRTGQPVGRFPKVAGTVHAMVADGEGGWYIAGEFSAVGGLARGCLAQIRADGSVSDWDPNVSGSPGYIEPPSVSSLAIFGEKLFIGGAFRVIGDQPHENLGCLDLATGRPVEWNMDVAIDGLVYDLVVHDSTLFVGGFFMTIAGQPRRNLAAFDATTGELKPWLADASASVWTLLARGDTLLVGGEFDWIAGAPRNFLAALDASTAQLLPFDARANGVYIRYAALPGVFDLALVGDTLYTSGSFSEIGGRTIRSLAALDLNTALALPWTPPSFNPERRVGPRVKALTVNGPTLYVGGNFDRVDGKSQPQVAAIDRATGALLAWNPRPDNPVEATAIRGDTIFLAGEFGFFGDWQHRAGLAAIDLTTGALKPWNPNPNGVIVTALAVQDGRVYVSGDFSIIGGAPTARNRFAALDTLNGEVLDWDFGGADRAASSLLLRGDTLFAAGAFAQFGGQPRAGLASVHAITGAVTSWNPQPFYDAITMARLGETIYFGGLFRSVAGQSRRNVAAVDAITGTLLPWAPNPDNFIEALTVGGGKVYLGGAFSTIGGQPRQNLAAVDAVTGEVTDWNPGMDNWAINFPRVLALALHDSLLWVGGNYSAIGGQPRICLATVDTSTGLATAWDPQTNGNVWSLAASEQSVFVGGGFTRVSGLPAAGLMAFETQRAPSPAAPGFSLATSFPNPARTSAVIRFTLTRSAPAQLTVHDLQGRLVATLLDGVELPAGPHQVQAPTANWRPGVYLYRLVADGRSATRKLVVLD